MEIKVNSDSQTTSTWCKNSIKQYHLNRKKEMKTILNFGRGDLVGFEEIIRKNMIERKNDKQDKTHSKKSKDPDSDTKQSKSQEAGFQVNQDHANQVLKTEDSTETI